MDPRHQAGVATKPNNDKESKKSSLLFSQLSVIEEVVEE